MTRTWNTTQNRINSCLQRDANHPQFLQVNKTLQVCVKSSVQIELFAHCVANFLSPSWLTSQHIVTTQTQGKLSAFGSMATVGAPQWNISSWHQYIYPTCDYCISHVLNLPFEANNVTIASMIWDEHEQAQHWWEVYICEWKWLSNYMGYNSVQFILATQIIGVS